MNWLYYQLIFADLNKYATGVAQPGLSVKNIKEVFISIPTFSEQKAIGNLLSTWDEAIDKIERLIQAKENQLKFLMKSLVVQSKNTQTTKEFSLSELCDQIKDRNSVGETNVLTPSAHNGLVSQLEFYKKSVSAENLSNYYLIKKGDFVYNRCSANGYPYGAIKRLDKYSQGVLSNLYICFSIKNYTVCESDYLLYLFESGGLNKKLRAICQEGARNHGLLNIKKSDFFEINCIFHL